MDRRDRCSARDGRLFNREDRSPFQHSQHGRQVQKVSITGLLAFMCRHGQGVRIERAPDLLIECHKKGTDTPLVSRDQDLLQIRGCAVGVRTLPELRLGLFAISSKLWLDDRPGQPVKFLVSLSLGISRDDLVENVCVAAGLPVDRQVILDRCQDQRNSLIFQPLADAVIDVLKVTEQAILGVFPFCLAVAVEHGLSLAASFRSASMKLELFFGLVVLQRLIEASRDARQINFLDMVTRAGEQPNAFLADGEYKGWPIADEQWKQGLQVKLLGDDGFFAERQGEGIVAGEVLGEEHRQTLVAMPPERVVVVMCMGRRQQLFRMCRRDAALVKYRLGLLKQVLQADSILFHMGRHSVSGKVQGNTGSPAGFQQVLDFIS